MAAAEKQDHFLPISVKGLAASFVICLSVVLIGGRGAVQADALTAFVTVFILFFGAWFLVRMRGIRRSKQRFLGRNSPRAGH